jgi:hypothetical protein
MCSGSAAAPVYSLIGSPTFPVVKIGRSTRIPAHLLAHLLADWVRGLASR